MVARFSATVQTGPGAPPASYTVGTGFVSRGIKRQGRGVNHPPPSNAETKERVELYIYYPSGPSRHVIGRTLPLPTLIFKNSFRRGICRRLQGHHQGVLTLGRPQLKAQSASQNTRRKIFFKRGQANPPKQFTLILQAGGCADGW